jgi:hypothetical protein
VGKTIEQFKTFGDYLAEQLRDPEFKVAWDALEPPYQRERQRIVDKTAGKMVSFVDVDKTPP